MRYDPAISCGAKHHILISPEDDGTFSAEAQETGGAGAGPTMGEALRAAKQALGVTDPVEVRAKVRERNRIDTDALIDLREDQPAFTVDLSRCGLILIDLSRDACRARLGSSPPPAWWDAHLEGAYLRDARLEGCRWWDATLDRTKVRLDQLGWVGDEMAALGWLHFGGSGHLQPAFREARDAYLAFKRNFESLGDYEGVAWAYVKEQQTERMMRFPTSAGLRWVRERTGWQPPPPHWWSASPKSLAYRAKAAWAYLRLFFRPPPAARDDPELGRMKWLRQTVYAAATLYGESVWRPIGWGAVIVLAFAAGFGLSDEPHGSWLDALTHSIATFATLGFQGLEPQPTLARLATAVEAMLGIVLFALIAFTMGNKMRRG